MKTILFVVLTISATCCLTVASESIVTKAFKDFKIIPHVVSGNVPELLNVTFDSGVCVDLGNEIPPSQAKGIYEIDWHADEDAYYTIICTAPDAPSPGNPFLGEVIVWMIGNIPGKTIDSGRVLVEYSPAVPPRGAKLNRIIFLVYKQPHELNFEETSISRHSFVGRPHFSTKQFSEKYGLGDPVAGNFYMTQYDPFVLDVYKEMNCCFEYNSPKIQYT